MSTSELSKIVNALLDIGVSIKDIAERLDLEFEHIEMGGIYNEEAKA
mgnify:CR=1 FL=1|jgi:DNA-binding transcriptional MerR regulator